MLSAIKLCHQTNNEPPLVHVRELDRFGYYLVDDQKFYNKTDAALVAERSNQKLCWYFNDSIYSSYDWTLEPLQSLDELYRLRAQQLREKYDYLVLFLSGGADSSNIFRAFIKNDIKLDEVASYMNYQGTKDTTGVFNGEVYHVVPDLVKQAKQQQPWLTHTVIDLSPLTMNYYAKSESKFDWMYDLNHYMNPNNVARQDMKLSVRNWRKMFDQGVKVGFIHGCDKPCVRGIKGQYYFSFKDMVDGVVSSRTQQLARPWEFDELFYWTPDAPLIVIKQAHVVKKFLQVQNFQSASGLTSVHPHHQPHAHISDCWTIIDGRQHWLSCDNLHQLIYPGWSWTPYQIKSRSLLFSDRDQWFLNMNDLDKSRYSWRVGLEEAWRRAPTSIKVDATDISKGFRHITSKWYKLN